MSQNQLVIFDFDGVIVDTEYTTFCFYRDILPKWDIYLKESDFKYKIARKSIDFFKDVLKDKFDENLVNSLITLKRQTFLNNIKKYLKIIPYSIELLQACQKDGFRLALGSQNERELIDKALDTFSLRHYFEMTVALQDLTRKKPHPEIFLLISHRLQIPPSQAVVIEDGKEGIRAAKLGGFKAVGYTNAFSREQLAQENPDLIVDSLDQLNPQLLRSL